MSFTGNQRLPSKKFLRIDELYAFVVVGQDGEGLCAFLADGVWMPMVGADTARIDSLRQKALEMARETGVEIRLMRFSQREEIEVIKP